MLTGYAPKARRYAALALAVAIAALVAGCGGSDSSGSSKSAGDTPLTIGTGSGDYIDSFNPLDTECFVCQAAFRMLYPYVVQYNLTGTAIEGDFATKWTHNSAGTTWTFTTRSGAKWSDGQPLTAADAAWTLNTFVKYQSGPTANYSNFVAGIREARAPTATTLVITYAHPLSTTLDSLAQIPIFPQHIWAKYAVGSGKALTTFANSTPVAAGPYVLAKAAQEQYALFTANPSYYGPKPTIENWGFQFFQNQDAVVNALESHAVEAGLDLPPSSIQQLKANPNLRVETLPGTDVQLLEINSSPDQHDDHELQNPQVRDAFALAINYAQLIRIVQNGAGQATGSLIPPALSGWYDKAIPSPTTDPAKANAILDALGYHRGSDGIRVADGHPMSYQFPYPNGDDPRMIQELVSDFAAIGVKLTPISESTDPWIAGVQGNKYATFAITINDFGPTYDPSVQLSMETCGQYGGLNMSGYCNSHYDNLFSQQLAVTGSARHQVVDQLQAILAAQRPVIPLFARDTITATWKNVDVPLASSLIYNYETKDWLTGGTAG